MFIHGRSGRIRERNTYGTDHHPPRVDPTERATHSRNLAHSSSPARHHGIAVSGPDRTWWTISMAHSRPQQSRAMWSVVSVLAPLSPEPAKPVPSNSCVRPEPCRHGVLSALCSVHHSRSSDELAFAAHASDQHPPVPTRPRATPRDNRVPLSSPTILENRSACRRSSGLSGFSGLSSMRFGPPSRSAIPNHPDSGRTRTHSQPELG